MPTNGLMACIFLTLLHGAASAPWTPENAAWNVNINPEHDPANYAGSWPGHSFYPSPDDWRDLPVYQLITDRFADGDPLNNVDWPDYTTDFDVRDMTRRHGGDFRGVIDQLDYIQGLGCRAIWISPVFQNGYNNYHQYAQRDFTLIDKRMGTLADLRALSDAVHARGMYLLIDVVVNHMANEFKFEGPHLYPQEGAAPYRLHDGGYGWTPPNATREYELVPRNDACRAAGCQPYADYHFNNTWDPGGRYTGEYLFYDKYGEAVADTGAPMEAEWPTAWVDAPAGLGTYSGSDFHHNGDLTHYDDPFIINTGKIYGSLDDLRTESPRVQAKHIAAAKALIESADIDGFRIDTPMQVDLSFFKARA